MEVGAAEAERAHAGPADPAFGFIPVCEPGVDVERRMLKIDVRVLGIAVQARWQDFLIERHHRLEYAGGSRGTLEVTDIGLDRSQRNAPRLGAGVRKDVRQALYLDDIADTGRGAVTFDVACG